MQATETAAATVQQFADKAVADKAAAAEIVKRLRQEHFGESVTVGILGSLKLECPESEQILTHAAGELHAVKRLKFVTAGAKGAQEVFARACGDGSSVYNLLPQGQDSNFEVKVGTDVVAGASPEQRKEVLAQLCDLYVTFEGGPGVAQPAQIAHGRGAAVVPVARTGGASSGMFGFPAIDKPAFASQEQWALLNDKDVPAEVTADAIVAIVQRFASNA
jgi:hypothetical protein